MKQAFDATARGLRTFASDVAEGFFEITHNGFALVGLAIVFAALALVARPDLRQAGEEQLMGWLQARKPAPEATTDLRAHRDRPRHGRQPAGPAQAAGRRRLLAEQEVPRGARAAERAGGRGLRDRQAHQARPDADPGHHGRRIGLQPVRPEPRGRPGPDAGHDRRPQRQVRELRRQAGRLRPGDQPARGRQGAAGMHRSAPARSKAACSTTSAPPTCADDGGYAGKVLAEHARLQPGGRRPRRAADHAAAPARAPWPPPAKPEPAADRAEGARCSTAS